MPNHNQCSFIGHIGKDAEKKNSKSGDQVWADFSVAVTDRNKETMWISCKIFGRSADNAVNFCKKGASVFVTGRLSVSAYMSKDGQPRPNISLICSEWQILSKIEATETPSQSSNRPGFEPQGLPSFDDLPF